MSSWRIITKEEDNTQRATTSTPNISASVIVSPKGPNHFYRFEKGDTKKVIETFGYPSKDYPTIQDAIDIVTKSTTWLASPYSGGKYGGVFITPNKTISFTNGFSSQSISDFSNITFTETIGVGDGNKTVFTYSIPNPTLYKSQSLTLKVGGVADALTITTSEGVETISDASGSSLLTSGTLTLSSGALSLTFTTAPTNGTTIEIGFVNDMSTCNVALFDRNMQNDDLKVKVTKSTEVANALNIYVERYDETLGDYEELSNSPFVVGLKETSKDNMGGNIYIENIFNDDQFLFKAVINNDTISSTFVDDTDYVALSGGNRGDEVEGEDVASLYNDLQDTNKFKIKVAFDGTGFDDVPTVFETLRNSYQKYCRFMYPTTDVSASTIIGTPTTYNYGITNNRGLYQYCLTWGIHKDIYNGNDFNCSNMGLIAGRMIDVLNNGGGVPAMIDENGVGGILGSSIVKLNQSVTETQMESLDDLNFNVVVNDYNNGPMICGWKTRLSSIKTVFSSIGQSSLADTIIELIVTSVLPPRLGKLIDDTTYTIVTNGCNEIASTYSKYLEDYLTLCNDDVNTSETKNQQKLIVKFGVIFKGYAEKIMFTFSTYKNGVSISEEMSK